MLKKDMPYIGLAAILLTMAKIVWEVLTMEPKELRRRKLWLSIRVRRWIEKTCPCLFRKPPSPPPPQSQRQKPRTPWIDPERTKNWMNR